MKEGDKVTHRRSRMVATVIDVNEGRGMIVVEYDGDHAFAKRHGMSRKSIPRITCAMANFEPGGQMTEPECNPIEPIYRVVASKIREARQMRGMSQERLADQTGLARVTMVNIEAGRHRITLHALIDVAKVLRMPAEWFVFEPRGRQLP